MGINSTEVSYGFGQLGSVFNDTASAITPPTNKVFVAITFLAETQLLHTGGLVAEQDSANGMEYISSLDTAGAAQTAHDIAHGSAATALSGAGGVVVDASNVFPSGVTIYGRWSEVHASVASAYIAYIGD